jgi:cytochrome b subunit of formate dehydrogenase/mono/diheme cytochrome c family protein
MATTTTTTDQAAPQQRSYYKRFTAAQRFEHMVLLVTFTGLAITGLPQRYAGADWAQTMIAIMGGIESVRIVHRVLAVLLMAESIYHGGVVSYKLFVLGRSANMIPGLKDGKDVIQWIGYNLGFTKEHPEMPRYNFGEKAEYLAVVWGTVLMAITGFMLWNPITTAEILPAEVIPAARAAHSAEALLAIAAIIIWHMYNVHLKYFNRSMFTGKMPRHIMEEEHGEELARIERGEAEPELPDEVKARRSRYFWPYAIVMTVLLTGGLYWFVTVENTAITTLPQRQGIVINTDVDLTQGNIAQGEEIWMANCAGCHGAEADAMTVSPAISLVDRDLDFRAFVSSIRRGPAEMPAFSVVQISDEDTAHLWAWFQDVRGEPLVVNTSQDAEATAEPDDTAEPDEAGATDTDESDTDSETDDSGDM